MDNFSKEKIKECYFFVISAFHDLSIILFVGSKIYLHFTKNIDLYFCLEFLMYKLFINISPVFYLMFSIYQISISAMGPIYPPHNPFSLPPPSTSLLSLPPLRQLYFRFPIARKFR